MGNRHSLKPIDPVLNGNSPRSRFIDRLLDVDPMRIKMSGNVLVCYDRDGLQRARVYVHFVDYDMLDLPIDTVIDVVTSENRKMYRLKKNIVVMGSCFKYDLVERFVYHRYIITRASDHDITLGGVNKRFARSFDRIKALAEN